MDAFTKKIVEPFRQFRADEVVRPSREEAEAAVRTLIAWAGDDPKRDGLIDTPQRVVDAYEEFYAGYRQNAADARLYELLGSRLGVALEDRSAEELASLAAAVVSPIEPEAPVLGMVRDGSGPMPPTSAAGSRSGGAPS